MARMIDGDAVMDRYYAEYEQQDICDGAEDRDWLMKCLTEAPTLTQPNEPLTLEVLRKMEGEPFYDCASREWYIVNFVSGSKLYTDEGVYFNFCEEETEGRFYRRPPEGEET